MKQLTCEMCGSTDLVKNGGVFVCQSCGCKYSVEEAKKMMIEGTVDVSGSSVKIDNSDMIENYLNLAISAIDSSNNQEAESYANKILEIDPNNSMAWVIKGASAAWQTTGENNRFNEAVDCWIQAINYLNYNEDKAVLKYVYDSVNDLTNAILKMHCDNFVSYRSEENFNTVCDLSTYLKNEHLRLIEGFLNSDFFLRTNQDYNDKVVKSDEPDEMIRQHYNIVQDCYYQYIELLDLLNQAFSIKLNACAVNASNAADADFGPDISDKTDYAYSIWLNEMLLCIKLENVAMVIAQEIDTVETICKNIVTMRTNMINSCSYEFSVSGYSSGFVRSKFLTESAKSSHRKEITEAKEKAKVQIKKIKEEKAEKINKKIEKYWEEHKEEKEALEKEKQELSSKIKETNAQKNNEVNAIEKEKLDIPGKTELEQLNAQKKSLEEQKKGLGVFKNKEKKALQEEIDVLAQKIKKLEDDRNEKIERIDAKIKKVKLEYEQKTRAFKSRVEEIDTELTKER